jgi:hypothetical protein
MTDQATALRTYVLQHGPANRDDRGNITVEIAPAVKETFEDYNRKMARLGGDRLIRFLEWAYANSVDSLEETMLRVKNQLKVRTEVKP